MFYIRQNATHKVVIGPCVAVGDGFTPVTTLSLSTADEAEAILHDNATVVDISAYTFAAITTADGYYHLTLQSGISGTVGHMTVVINDDSLCLPLRADFTVLEEAAYDAMYKAAAEGPAVPTQVNAQVLDVLNTDTFAEPAQGIPAATTTLAYKIGFIYKTLRNKKTATATAINIFNDDTTTVDHKRTISDDATTYTEEEIVSGP